MKTLENKVAVITGASRGFGLAVARLFAHEGAKVVLSSRSQKIIEQNGADLRQGGLNAAAFACDVTDRGQVEDLARFAIQTYGHFDVWVNNAGVGGPYGATFDLPAGDFQSVLNTNILGTYHGSLMAMRHFLPRKTGKLINLTGAGARKPAPLQNAYGSSKAWIRMFTLALAKEYKDTGVGVFVLQPGMMETELLTEIVTFQEHETRLRRVMSMVIRAIGKPPEVPAQKALWLASSATDGKTGLEVQVGSMPAVLWGFLREGLHGWLHLPSRPVEINVKTIPSALEPLPTDDEQLRIAG